MTEDLLTKTLATRMKTSWPHVVRYADRQLEDEEVDARNTWCGDRCNGVWQYRPYPGPYSCWAFHDENDYMMFMLRWSGS